MGRNKNKLKRDRVTGNEHADGARCNSQTNNKIINLENSKPNNGYGIRHLLEQTEKSRNDSFPEGSPTLQQECIDINSIFSEEEVIDLTDTTVKMCDEPTVIDISEEEPTAKSEGEDVRVIGVYTKPPQNPNPSDKYVANHGLTELIECRETIAMKKFVMVKSKNSVSRLKNRYKNMSRLKARQKFKFSRCLHNKCKKNLGELGSNVYVNSPLPLPSSGLRPIIIDGNNVAYVNASYHFSCKRLEICINYFKEKGHKVIAFVPQFRMSFKSSDDPNLLKKLERQGLVILTPSKEVDGKKIVPYDDRFIVQTAALKGGIIVSRDNYKDLLQENPAWGETIKYRTLAYTWVDDVLMFPEDPLGEFGPSLEQFLRFD